MTSASSLEAALAFDRAAILRGELWRALTGQWLHASASHLLWNTLALSLGASAVLLLRGGWRALEILALGHLVTALTVLLLLPQWLRYQGASGVAAALEGGAVLAALLEGPLRLRCAALAAAFLLALKLLLEARNGVPLLASAPGTVTDFKVHALPALVGAVSGWRRRGAVVARSEQARLLPRPLGSGGRGGGAGCAKG